MARIPVNIISGFLGVGKTTAILHLLKNKPAGEKWAVVVNEFGEVSIDGPIISQSGDNITIKDISGGCMCCVGKAMFDAAMAEISIRMKPDRVLVEPSGLGHIGDLITTLQSKTFRNYVAVKTPICLIDPRHLKNQMILESLIFQSQVEQSPILIANKSDLATEEELKYFSEWAAKVTPVKKQILSISQGNVPMQLLDTDMPDKNDHGIKILGIFHEEKIERSEHKNPEPGKPFTILNSDQSFTGTGFIFHANDVFDPEKIKKFLEPLQCIRMKGIIKTTEGWFLFQKATDSIAIDKSLPQPDSRLEIIYSNSALPDVKKLEADLLNTLK
jgi:G3E family GTPase